MIRNLNHTIIFRFDYIHLDWLTIKGCLQCFTLVHSIFSVIWSLFFGKVFLSFMWSVSCKMCTLFTYLIHDLHRIFLFFWMPLSSWALLLIFIPFINILTKPNRATSICFTGIQLLVYLLLGHIFQQAKLKKHLSYLYFILCSIICKLYSKYWRGLEDHVSWL